MLRRGKSSLYPFEFLAETLIIKDKLTKEKHRSLLTCILHVHMRDTQWENVSLKAAGGLEFRVKYHINQEGEGGMWPHRGE